MGTVEIFWHAEPAAPPCPVRGPRNTTVRGSLSCNQLEAIGAHIMSDYYNPNDPLSRGNQYDLDARNTNGTWGWVAGALFIVVVLAVVFGMRHEPNQLASNTAAPPPPATHMTAPPSEPTPPPSAMPRPAVPLAPTAPAPSGTNQ